MSNILPIHTPCKGCTFAIYNDKTQVGCQLNKIEAFKKANREIIEAYDEEAEFYIINGAICISKRGPIFEQKHKGKNLISIVKEETSIKYIAIVFYDLFTSTEDLIERIQELNNQPIKPQSIHIINKIESNFIKLRNTLMSHSTVNIEVQTILDEKLLEPQLVDLCVDRTFYKNHSMYLVVKGNEKITIDIGVVQEKIEAGVPIVYVENEKGNLHLVLCNKYFHRKHGGNSFNVDLKTKLIEFEPGADKFIYLWNKL